MKERIIGISTIATVIAAISLIYLTGDGLTEIEKRIEARQSVTIEESSIQSDFIYPWVIQLATIHMSVTKTILGKQFIELE